MYIIIMICNIKIFTYHKYSRNLSLRKFGFSGCSLFDIAFHGSRAADSPRTIRCIPSTGHGN